MPEKDVEVDTDRPDTYIGTAAGVFFTVAELPPFTPAALDRGPVAANNATGVAMQISQPYESWQQVDFRSGLHIHPNPAVQAVYEGRADVVFDSGAFVLRIYPTAPELRDMAAGLLATALRLDERADLAASAVTEQHRVPLSEPAGSAS